MLLAHLQPGVLGGPGAAGPVVKKSEFFDCRGELSASGPVQASRSVSTSMSCEQQ